MKERMNIDQIEPRIFEAMDHLEIAIQHFDLYPGLLELLKLRTSQINGCGYCVNLHSLEAQKAGVSLQRIFAVSAWWETPFFSEREKAALKVAEEITRISVEGLSESTFQAALQFFSEKEIAQLIFTVVVTNSWNRLAVAMHMVAEKIQ